MAIFTIFKIIDVIPTNKDYKSICDAIKNKDTKSLLYELAVLMDKKYKEHIVYSEKVYVIVPDKEDTVLLVDDPELIRVLYINHIPLFSSISEATTAYKISLILLNDN